MSRLCGDILYIYRFIQTHASTHTHTQYIYSYIHTHIHTFTYTHTKNTRNHAKQYCKAHNLVNCASVIWTVRACIRHAAWKEFIFVCLFFLLCCFDGLIRIVRKHIIYMQWICTASYDYCKDEQIGLNNSKNKQLSTKLKIFDLR